jgi:hypothetical protein
VSLHTLLRSVQSGAPNIITGCRLGKTIVREMEETIQKYNDGFDRLIQNFQDQVALLHAPRTGKVLDILVTPRIFIPSQKKYWDPAV